MRFKINFQVQLISCKTKFFLSRIIGFDFSQNSWKHLNYTSLSIYICKIQTLNRLSMSTVARSKIKMERKIYGQFCQGNSRKLYNDLSDFTILLF